MGLFKKKDSKPSECKIRELINVLSSLQSQASKRAEQRNNYEFNVFTAKFNTMLETYKNPLLMAWQLYGYGWHSDFWKEGDSMLSYEIFECQAREVITSLIASLEGSSPFAPCERDSMITNGLLSIYRHMLKQDLRNIKELC